MICVMNQLNTILPVSLRAHCKDYYSSDSQANRFVVINRINATGFDISMGVWTSTAPSTHIRRKASIYLHKDIGEKGYNEEFEQESPHILRQDEFEWLLKGTSTYVTHAYIIKEALLGDPTAIIIYLHLQELSKLFHIETVLIFDYLDKFRLKYNPNELITKPW